MPPYSHLLLFFCLMINLWMIFLSSSGKNFLRAAQMNMNFATWGHLMMSILPRYTSFTTFSSSLSTTPDLEANSIPSSTVKEPQTPTPLSRLEIILACFCSMCCLSKQYCWAANWNTSDIRPFKCNMHFYFNKRGSLYGLNNCQNFVALSLYIASESPVIRLSITEDQPSPTGQGKTPEKLVNDYLWTCL